MKLLALDTTMQACSAAVYDDAGSRILSERYELMDRGHAEAIAPMVDDVLKAAALKPQDLNRIGVTRGPGTFTGVRIGLSMARGLGLALGVPVIGINTLHAIAQNAGPQTAPLLVVADARLGEVYAALYDASGNETLAPTVMTAAELPERLPQGPVNLLGSAAGLVHSLDAERFTHLTSGDLPRSSNFARWAAGQQTTATMPSPLYLRNAGAVPPRQEAWHSGSEVREAGMNDLAAMAALHAAAFERPWTVDEWKALMIMPGASASLIAADGLPESMILVREAGREAEILTLCTSPLARRKGHARALLAAETARLRKNGITALFIEVAASNEAALCLYRGSGFAEKGRRKNYYERSGGRHEDAIIMRKELSP